MEYKIVVAKHRREFQFGKWHDRYDHLFTASNLQSEHAAKQAYDELMERFPSPKFKVEATLWRTQGEQVAL